MLQDSDISRFRELLELKLLELDQFGVGMSSRDQAVELDQSKVGRLSRMDALQQQAMLDATKVRAQRERVRIQKALSRIEKGEFGQCVQCDETIALGRLDFDPATPLCIVCASGVDSA
ncbi:MAG: TraR/DksA family transcriptional regulator [Pseudomonas sp.]|nr:MAG: TraR/DksA family transcriptional regulator [Pseudomonas sp.]